MPGSHNLVADVERDIALFRGRTKQYAFISSASAYQKPRTIASSAKPRRQWRRPACSIQYVVRALVLAGAVIFDMATREKK